jgi:molybdate transport system regulatory protein
MKQLPHLQLRVRLSSAAVFGPGKADLLDHIAASGSISAAARRMRMSYKRAWQLVDDMNRAFRAPLVTTNAGGTQGGGAVVTANGKRVLNCYRTLQRNAEAAAWRELAALARLGAKA